MIGLFHNDVLEYYEAIDKKEGLLFKYVEFARKQEKELTQANTKIDRLCDALNDLLASISGGEKSCGHEFTCICAGDKARKIVKEIKDNEEGV